MIIICSGRGLWQRERGVLRAMFLAEEQRQGRSERVDQQKRRLHCTVYVSQWSIEDGALGL